MDDEAREKEERFKRQQEILKRLNDKNKSYKWNDNHKLYTRRPSLKQIDRHRLKEEAIRSLNELEDL